MFKRVLRFPAFRIAFIMSLMLSAVATALRPIAATPLTGDCSGIMDPKNPCHPIPESILILSQPPFNIPGKGLPALVPLINDLPKMVTQLEKVGMTPDQVKDLDKQLIPLTKDKVAAQDKDKVGLEPLSTGAIEDFEAQGGEDTLTRNGLPAKDLDGLLADGSDKVKLDADLTKDGANPTQKAAIEKDLSFYEDMGLNKQAHAHLLAHDEFALMDQNGLDKTKIGELLTPEDIANPTKLANDIKALNPKLTDTQLQTLVGDIGALIQEGLTSDVELAYIAQAAADQLFGKGLSEDEIQAAMKVRDDSKAFAAELDKDGLSQDDIKALANDMANDEKMGLDDNHLKDTFDQENTATDNLDKILDPNNTGKIDNTDQPTEPTDPNLDGNNGGTGNTNGGSTGDGGNDNGGSTSGGDNGGSNSGGDNGGNSGS